MKYRFHIADVFTTSAFGGNQLAVLPNAAGLSDQGMQHIAREFNFTETTFVLPPQTKANTYRVRIFTPRAEVQFAGHPIVGTACALVEGGYFGRRDAPRTDLILEEGVGPISAVVKPMGRRSEIHASATQLCPGVTSVSVGGTCVAVASGELEVPTQWLV